MDGSPTLPRVALEWRYINNRSGDDFMDSIPSDLALKLIKEADGRVYVFVYSEPDHTLIQRSDEGYETERKAFDVGIEMIRRISEDRSATRH